MKSPQIPSKQEQKEIIEKYWQEIEEMNQNIPPEIKLKKYQSHRAKIVKMASPSCSNLGYLK